MPMSETAMENELYFAVFPQISLSPTSFGKTEQVLTLMPDKNFATEFFPDEVDSFIQVFRNRMNHLVGGHVTGYEFNQESTKDGRVLVRVTQNVER